MTTVVALASSCATYESRQPPWAGKAEQTGNLHRVAPGDQLGKLARSYGVSLAALVQANGVSPPYTIYVGQELRIPGRAESGPEDEPTMIEPAGAVPPATVTSKSVVAAMPAVTRYVVEQRDDFLAIAKRFQIHPDDLARANGLISPYQVSVGQPLRIPGSAERRAWPPAMAQIARRSTAEPAKETVLSSLPPIGEAGFLWPVRGKVVEAFGPAADGSRADGITIAARKGMPVLAAESGIVAFAGEGLRAYGLMLLIRHDDDYITTYAHNSVLLVAEGEVVRRGQAIARVGNTGDAPRGQLHFELRKGRTPIDPEQVLVTEPTAVASTQ